MTNVSRAGIVALLCGAAVWPVSGFGAKDEAFRARFSADVATAWQVNHADGDDYIAPQSGPGPVVYDPKHPFVPTQPATNIQPTYRVADLSNPILKPWAVEQMRKANDEVLKGKVPFVPRERCVPAGTPAYVLEPPFNITIFIETPKEILMIHQNDHQIRHIFMNVPHTAHPKPSYTGESVGHWEGDELVVDTIAIDTRTFVDNYRTPHTDKLHVIERFGMIDGGKQLQDTIKVEDDGAYNMPWTAVQRWNRTNRGPIEEDSCSENNEHIFNFDVRPMPTATRSDF
ncbi:MAG TPA: hypothetical protein VEU06_08005 [Micropepsaceae bacterium]|nr:hypothetical protein [Micropepsaceae bacterium]